MGKILGSWSAMRKYLEEEMICDKLKGRIRYSCTTYPNMDCCGLFELYIDGKCSKRFSMETIASSLSRVNEPANRQEFWSRMWQEKDRTPLEKREEFDDVEFSDALKIYRNSDIKDSIKSENPIVRMFAIFDRRIGKRTLVEIKKSLAEQPKWLVELYQIRLKSEGI